MARGGLVDYNERSCRATRSRLLLQEDRHLCPALRSLLERSLLKAFIWNFSTSGIILAVGMATSVLSARILGPTDRGYLGIILFWGQFLAPLAALSFGDALILKGFAPSNRDELLSRAYGLTFANVIVVLPAGCAVILWAMSRQSPFLVGSALTCWCAQVVMLCVDQVAQGSLRAERRFAILNALRIGTPTLYLALMMVAVALGGAIVLFVGANVLALLLALAVRLYVTNAWRVVTTPAARGKHLFRTAIGLHQTSVLVLLNAQIDRLVVVQTETAERIGFYLIALTLAGPIQGFLTNAINTVALPALSGASHASRPFATLRLLRLTWIGSVGGAILMMIASPLIVPILFGAAYKDAVSLTAALTAALTFGPTRAAFREAFKSEGETKQLVMAEVVFVACFIASYGMAMALALPWTVVWALAAANIVATLYQGLTYEKRHPEITLTSWVVPTASTFFEALSLLRAVTR